jgi:hypothetical protein
MGWRLRILDVAEKNEGILDFTNSWKDDPTVGTNQPASLLNFHQSHGNGPKEEWRRWALARNK